MSYQPRMHGPLAPALLLSIQICLGGCAVPLPRHNGPTAAPGAQERETPAPLLPTTAGAEDHRTSDQSATTVNAERFDRTAPSIRFLPPADEPPGSIATTADNRLEPEHKRQLLPGSRASQLRYAELIRELGTADEKRWLREYLKRNQDDPDFRNFSISWHLDREEYDAARYLIRRAQAENQPVPLWQRLVLAVDEGDTKAVERLLSEANGKLPVTTQVETLRALNLDQQALTLAQNYLNSLPPGDDMDNLSGQVDALALPRSHLIGFDWATQKLGSLLIDSGTTHLDLFTPRARIAFQVADNRLYTDSDDVLTVDKFDRELDLFLRIKRFQPSKQTELELKLGGNLRDDKSVLYGQVAWAQRIAPDLRGRVTLSLNEVSQATPILRAIGTKHSLSFATTANLDRWEFARAKFELHRYQTRDNDRLGTGYSAEAALGHVLLQELPRWHIELRGSLEDNDLRSEVPSDLIPTVLRASTEMEDIIPDDFQTLGIGTTFQYGSAEMHQKNAMFDAWAGWLWPASEASYNIRLSAGMPVFSGGMLSIDAFYANALSGITDEAYHRIGISYRYRF